MRGVALLALALVVAGCGSSTARTHGLPTPRGAVESFLHATTDLPRGAANDPKPLAAACAMLSPDIRPGMRFDEGAGVDPDVNCSRALALILYYVGDTAAVRAPQGYSGVVQGVSPDGDRAVVTVDMTYRYPTGPRKQTTNVLVVRRHGRWWIATPGELNVLASLHGAPSATTLADHYRRYLKGAQTAEAQQHQADRQTTQVRSGLNACPSGGASRAPDGSHDIRISDGGQLAGDQPSDADLAGVTESRDGDALCFQLRFAGAPPTQGETEIWIRPQTAGVTVVWRPSGEVIGQELPAEQSLPVRVDASRGPAEMTVRIPASALRNPQPPYRWAVQLGVPVPNDRVSYIDSVPDDLTVQYDGSQYVDNYIHQDH